MPALDVNQIPFLKDAPHSLLEEFQRYAVLKQVEKGQLLLLEGDSCPHFFVLLSGRIRVFKNSESGREVTLYYVDPGQSCVLTAFCVLSGSRFPASAMVEQTSQLVLIPDEVLRQWTSRFSQIREYLFSLLSRRLNDILQMLDSLIFDPLEVRLARLLLQAAEGTPPTVQATHERLARDLGSSRVVISRILESWKRKGLVELARGRITLRNPPALDQIQNYV